MTWTLQLNSNGDAETDRTGSRMLAARGHSAPSAAYSAIFSRIRASLPHIDGRILMSITYVIACFFVFTEFNH